MISICTFQLTEMVNLHFLSLMEALAECKSTVLSLLLPLWTPVLQAQNPQVLNLICKGAKINLFLQYMVIYRCSYLHICKLDQRLVQKEFYRRTRQRTTQKEVMTNIWKGVFCDGFKNFSSNWVKQKFNRPLLVNFTTFNHVNYTKVFIVSYS